MDAEKGESTKSPKKDKSAAENGSTMVVIKNEQEDKPKNPAELDVHPVFPEKQFATATTAEKPMNDDLKMPQQDQMDSKKVKLTMNGMDVKGPHQENSSIQSTPEQHTMKQRQQALNQELQGQQKDSTPAAPQQQNQMDAENGESKKSPKKEKPAENGSKMVVMNEEKDPFDNDVRPKYPTETTMQQPADPQQDQMDSKTTILSINEIDKGSHQEKSNVSLTPKPQQIIQGQPALNQEQRVHLTQEQLQIIQKELQLMIDRQQVERERKKLEEDQQKLKQQQQQVEQQQQKLEQQQEQLEQQQRKMEQQQRELMLQQLNANLPKVNATKTIKNLETAAEYANLPKVNATKTIKNLETADEYQCCFNSIHVKTLTRLIAVLHAFIILALLITLFCTSNLKSLNGFEIAGFILLGSSILTVAALFAGICLEDAKFVFIHVFYGWVEFMAIFFFGIYLCVIHFGSLTYEQLGITPFWAIFLTLFFGITIIGLRIWSFFVVLQCIDYYEENQKKS